MQEGGGTVNKVPWIDVLVLKKYPLLEHFENELMYLLFNNDKLIFNIN